MAKGKAKSSNVAFVFAFLFLSLSVLPSALFSTSFSSTQCPVAERDIFLAAVTGENSGGIFQLHVETKPGSGDTYASVNPRIGYSTQESEDTAVGYALAASGIPKESCDVLFKMNGDFSGSGVDGPSAGGAMAVAVRAALLNKSIRQDVVMTGTISPEGKVGAVGGIIEKGVGAADAGARYFIVPKLAVHEAVLLSSLSRTKNFHFIEVENVSRAEEALFSDYDANFTSEFKPESTPAPPSLPQVRMDADLGRFSLISKKVVDGLDRKVWQAYSDGAETPETSSLHSYFSKEVSKYYSLLPLGYVFTAANSAFLLSIDVEYAKIGDAEIDLNGSIQDVSSCLSSLPRAQMTKQNAHWAIGSDLRRIWAKARLNQTLEAREEQGGYATLRDLLFAESWCGISRELNSQASEIGGQAINESSLAHLASKELLLAEDEFTSSKKIDYDALWHLQNAEEANSSGDFGAAIYESAYARTMQSLASENVENVTEAAARLAGEERTSLWGKIYSGHGTYLFHEAQQGGFPPNDAYKILRYAQELDRVSSDIDVTLASPPQPSDSSAALQQNATAKQNSSDANKCTGCATFPTSELFAIGLSLCLIAVSLFAIYRISRKMKRG